MILFPLMAIVVSFSFGAAASPDKFCSQLINEAAKQERKTADKLTFTDTATALYSFIFKNSLIVEVHAKNELEKYLNEEEKSLEPGKKYAFIGIQEVYLNKADRSSLKEIKTTIGKAKANLKGRGFFQAFKKVNDFEGCLAFFDKNVDDLYLLEQLEKYLKQNHEILIKKKKADTYKQLKKNLPFLESRGWVVHQGYDLNQIHSIITEEKPGGILLLSHATEEGQLVDVYGNPLPPSYFANMPKEMKLLITYNCYADKVLARYGLNSAHRGFEYFYADVKERYASLFDQQVPVSSMRSLHKVLSSPVPAVQEKIKNCKLELEHEVPNHSYSLFLNGKLLGVLRSHVKEVLFDCGYLQDKNTVEVYRTIPSTHIGSINVRSLRFSGINSSLEISINEYISRNSNFHILTRGKF